MAQQQLAEARLAAEAKPAEVAPATPAATTTPRTVQPAEQPPAASPTPWLWGGLAFVGMALLAWLFVRRQPKSTPKPSPPTRRGFDSEALAASMVVPTQDDGASPAVVDDQPPAATPVRTEVDLADVPQSGDGGDKALVAGVPGTGFGGSNGNCRAYNQL